MISNSNLCNTLMNAKMRGFELCGVCIPHIWSPETLFLGTQSWLNVSQIVIQGKCLNYFKLITGSGQEADNVTTFSCVISQLVPFSWRSFFRWILPPWLQRLSCYLLVMQNQLVFKLRGEINWCLELRYMTSLYNRKENK